MAQLVARDFWEVEVAGSSPVTQTRSFFNWDWRSLVARTHGVREVRSSNLLSQTNHPCQGVAQLVARSVRDAEVAGSSPVTLTKTKRYLASSFFIISML